MLLLDKPRRHDFQRRAAGGQAAVQRRQGRPHRHASIRWPRGLLPLCFGEATKFVRLAARTPTRRYRCACRSSGVTTDTGDAEGEVARAPGRSAHRAAAASRPCCARFTGAIEQMPPMYSALKRDGQPLVRAGAAGHRSRTRAAPVTIHALDGCCASTARNSNAMCAAARAPTSGRWPRTSASALGCGAHVADAAPHRRRSLSMPRDMVTLERLRERAERAWPALDACCCPRTALVAHWPAVRLERRCRLLSAAGPAGAGAARADARAGARLYAGRAAVSWASARCWTMAGSAPRRLIAATAGLGR
ncbi:MAG: hypothetical protein MZW92_55125 [Comamonadaceae bacterium]|nr:hypothetical protein [Comamonadaceae bacterium]